MAAYSSAKLFYTIQKMANIIRCKDSIVNIPSDVEISEISTSIHSINRKKSDTGLKISDVIADFHTALKECDIIIGHNLQFDKNMITVECHRLHIRQMFNVYGVKKDGILYYEGKC